ncbi:MAG TPA: hypothetical protein DFR83_20795, partial [Deltaproteobacteria bacterium]|nr:hypothetical protein [Deltaproteobacteria bacterium]
KVEQWVELTVLAPPPPPEPPPPPPEVPKPKKKKKKPKKVRADQTVEKPPPEADAGEVQDEKPVRRIQGLSATSFGTGGTSGFSVRAGTSLGVAATDETMSLDEAASAVAYGAVAERPKCRKPSTRAPESVVDDELEGTVEVLFDVKSDGSVVNVRILKGIRADVDRNCIRAWSNVQCKPGRLLDNSPVMVTDMRYLCTYKGID